MGSSLKQTNAKRDKDIKQMENLKLMVKRFIEDNPVSTKVYKRAVMALIQSVLSKNEHKQL